MVFSISEKWKIGVLMLHWCILEHCRAMSCQYRFDFNGFLVNESYLCPPIAQTQKYHWKPVVKSKFHTCRGDMLPMGLELDFGNDNIDTEVWQGEYKRKFV